jgi:hypothetical protein
MIFSAAPGMACASALCADCLSKWRRIKICRAPSQTQHGFRNPSGDMATSQGDTSLRVLGSTTPHIFAVLRCRRASYLLALAVCRSEFLNVILGAVRHFYGGAYKLGLLYTLKLWGWLRFVGTEQPHSKHKSVATDAASASPISSRCCRDVAVCDGRRGGWTYTIYQAGPARCSSTN